VNPVRSRNPSGENPLRLDSVRSQQFHEDGTLRRARSCEIAGKETLRTYREVLEK
jgi:hypothetical protein